MRVRTKVCGMTRRDDVLAAAGLGVDAVGLVFYPKSPRNVSIEQAEALTADLPPFVTVTALFLDPEAGKVREVLERVRIDVLQFHGGEPADFCRSFGLPYIKAVPMGGHADLPEYARRHAQASALLLDSHVAGQKGGTGVSFDWSLVPRLDGTRIVLAGGLNRGNVATAIRMVRPYAVDVSSGVEEAPGIKDRAKMAAF